MTSVLTTHRTALLRRVLIAVLAFGPLAPASVVAGQNYLRVADMGGYSLPSRTIREMITSSIDVIVQAARLRDGSRRITHISEVLGMEGDVIVTQDVFLYDILGEDQNGSLVGRHRSTGITKPQFAERARYFNEEANLVEALEKSNLEHKAILNS